MKNLTIKCLENPKELVKLRERDVIVMKSRAGRDYFIEPVALYRKQNSSIFKKDIYEFITNVRITPGGYEYVESRTVSSNWIVDLSSGIVEVNNPGCRKYDLNSEEMPEVKRIALKVFGKPIKEE